MEFEKDLNEIIELLHGKELEYLISLVSDMKSSKDRMVDGKTHKGFKLRINRVMTVIWQQQIEEPWFYNGRFMQFDDRQRSQIFGLRPPSLARFEKFMEKIWEIDVDHPIKARMLTILAIMAPLILMMRYLDEIRIARIIDGELPEQDTHELGK